MSRRNALIISNAFTMEKSPLGQILRSQMKYLSRKNYNLTIIGTELGNAEWHENNSLVIKTPQYSFVKNCIAVIRRIFPDITFLPDTEYYSWGIFAKRYIFNLLKTREFDYIHSYSFSCANHLVALSIKRKTGLPWIVQFYDPWYDNPDRRFKTKCVKRMDLKLEKLIAENADVILIYTHQMISKWIERYGDNIAKKIVYVPLSVDFRTPYKHVSKKDNSKITITHVGNFILKRTSEVFINAVYNVLKKRPHFREVLRIVYVGNVTDRERELIKRKELSDIFDLVGRVSEKECIEYYMKSDIFLAIDAPFDNNIFYPSKVMKYFYYKKPILGITPFGSVLSDELKKSYHVAIDNNDAAKIEEYLMTALTNYQSLLNFDYNYWIQFSIDRIVSQYDEIISALIKEKQHFVNI